MQMMSEPTNLPRVEAAHVVITFHSTVHDGRITLFPDTFLGHLVVHPVGESPHGGIDLAEFHGGAGVVLHGGLEVLVKVTVVQEDVRVVEPAIEVPLDRLERLNHTVQLLVSGENDEGGVGPGALGTIGIDGHTARGEDLVMLFADFSVWGLRLAVRLMMPEKTEDTYRMEGGVPAGIKIPPGDEGCRTKRRRMKAITRQGNNKTNPRGIEMEELPFKRMRLRKKANLDEAWPFSCETSSRGRLGALGSRFAMR